MKCAVWWWAILTFASIAFAQTASTSSPPEPHKSCGWCHVPDRSLPEAAAPARRNQKDHRLRQTLPICLSCHDGMIGPGLDEIHDVHQGRLRNEPTDCLDCHNPHDRTGSYRMLRGTRGPETESSATLGFCRGCHTQYDNPRS
jgi:hypothetical protein